MGQERSRPAVGISRQARRESIPPLIVSKGAAPIFAREIRENERKKKARKRGNKKKGARTDKILTARYIHWDCFSETLFTFIITFSF